MPPSKEGKEGDKAEEPKKDAVEEREEAKAAAAPEGASSVLENRPKRAPSKSEKGATMMSDAMNVQIEGIDAFSPAYNDADAHGGYDRQTPARFAGERDDSLMRSLINNYSVELKDKDGKPTGNFFLDQQGARDACNEVLLNNSHFSADKARNWMNDNFASTWNHFDVNKDGIVEVGRFP
jgi:hypothetical protein